MNNKLVISVIILVFHDEQFLDRCIMSLKESAKFAQVQLEILIVVNDIKLKENGFKFPHGCKVIFNKTNLGFGKSINIAAKKARGKWLLIANVDTITDKFTLKKLITKTNKRNIGIVAPKILNTDGSLQYSILDKPNLWNIFIEQSYFYKLFPFLFYSYQVDKSFYEYSHYVEAISAAYFLIRNNIFQKIGGFDTNYFIYFEDIDLCERIIKQGYSIIFVNYATIIHIEHQSFGGFRNVVYYLNSLHRYWYKHNNKNIWFMVKILLIFGYTTRGIFWRFRELLFDNKSKEEARLKYNYYFDGIKYLYKL